MRLSHPIKVIYVGLLLGLWTSCTDDGGTTPTGCVNNEGCLEGYECHGDGLCYENAIVDDVFCIDNDGDGYGVGTIKARQKCPLCERLGLCGEDCDDNDKTRSPDGGEGCNGRDDNCDGAIDEGCPGQEDSGRDADAEDLLIGPEIGGKSPGPCDCSLSERSALPSFVGVLILGIVFGVSRRTRQRPQP